ncbi:hypothetical protein C8035_v002649 [Colletotrichum spinosum]|uniref:Peroxisomal membrane protein PEX14 n=1 Tax=Colletotrichum spinosum TaxID=1347390 RepID=A0A4R8Q842_9PEZI|nr:hypothetical protein C8035_v002649 [Colletotrichum spinosum]
MSDSDENAGSSGIPAWQRQQQNTDAEPQMETETMSQEAQDGASTEDRLDIARRFLQDEKIKDEPRQKKEEFLQTKGYTSSEIEDLLTSDPAQDVAQTVPAPAEAIIATPTPTPTPITEPQPTSENIISLRKADSPPVVTYPEFLTKPTRPPPLITANGVFNTLYAFAGLSTLVYGTSKYVVAPMVENLTEARAELHSSTATKLSALISKLEETVSEIPVTKSADSKNDDDAASASEIDDPTEMFHRDIGTQTSFPSTPRVGTDGISGFGLGGADDKNATVGERHTRKLTDMGSIARQLSETCVSEAEDLADLKASMDRLKDDLVQLAYPPPKDYTSGLHGYGARSNEPDDEIKKAKDNIRRVKGVLLSTRNFPATVAR